MGWFKKRRLEKLIKKIEEETNTVILLDDSEKLETLQKSYMIGKEEGLEKVLKLFENNYPEEVYDFIFYAVDNAEAPADISIVYKMLTCDEFKKILNKYGKNKGKMQKINELLKELYYNGYTFDGIKEIYSKLL